jgi:hypothetical protein
MNTDATTAADPGFARAMRLRAVLDDRATLLAELEAASARQDELVRSRETEALLGLLVERQRLVDRFIAGQGELLELATLLSEEPLPIGRDEAEALRRDIDAIVRGIARVSERDAATQELLRSVREGTRDELSRTERGSGARAAYGLRSAPTTPRFTDRRG